MPVSKILFCKASEFLVGSKMGVFKKVELLAGEDTGQACSQQWSLESTVDRPQGPIFKKGHQKVLCLQ